MKQHRDLSLRLVTLVGLSAAASVACGDELGTIGDETAGGGTTTVTAGTGSGVSGSSTTAGSGGTPATATGGSATAGTPSMAGTPSTGGTGTGGSGGSGGTASGGSGGTSGGSGGTSGGSGGTSGGSNAIGPFGITSCQPAFEVTCKPKIEFTNGDPDGRGKVFTNVIPDVDATMKDIACIACSILYRSADEIPQNKHPSTIKLVLDEHGGVAQAGGGTIQFDLNYINGYAGRTEAVIKQEMLGVLQHETVHLYQNYGNGGTGEGEADLVRTRMGYYPRSRWTKGGSWKDAYTTSGFFYSWLTGPCTFHSETYSAHDLNFPYKLNKALGGTSGDAAYTAVNNLLMQTFGKSADALWTEYQNTAF
jgi:hypothetical protein